MAESPNNTGFPEGSVPDLRLNPEISALCSFGHTQLVITGMIRQILLQHFVDPQNVVSASLRKYLEREGGWTEAGTGLYIEALARWRPEKTESRPAIVIKSNDWTWKRVGIGDQAGVDERTGRRFFTGYWEGTHTVFALGNEGAETQVLAAEIGKLLLWFGPLIADNMKLHRFTMVQIGALGALREATENYVVPVSVAYVSSESWWLQPEAPRLKRIVFRTDELLRGQ